MKRLIFILCAVCTCCSVYSETITLDWRGPDGTTAATTTCESGGDLNLPTAPTKTGYNFVGWRLPIYIPIGYIENVASETHINTGFYANQNSKIVVDFQQISCPSSNAKSYVFGSDLVTLQKSNQDFMYFGTTSSNWTNAPSTRHKITMKQDGYNLNDNSTVSWYYKPASSFISTPLIVFARSSEDIAACITRLYSLQLYQNEVLVHDYVPAMKPDGTVCLYDKVTDSFLYNSGTAPLVAGPIVDYD